MSGWAARGPTFLASCHGFGWGGAGREALVFDLEFCSGSRFLAQGDIQRLVGWGLRVGLLWRIFCPSANEGRATKTASRADFSTNRSSLFLKESHATCPNRRNSKRGESVWFYRAVNLLGCDIGNVGANFCFLFFGVSRARLNSDFARCKLCRKEAGSPEFPEGKLRPGLRRERFRVPLCHLHHDVSSDGTASLGIEHR